MVPITVGINIEAYNSMDLEKVYLCFQNQENNARSSLGPRIEEIEVDTLNSASSIMSWSCNSYEIHPEHVLVFVPTRQKALRW